MSSGFRRSVLPASVFFVVLAAHFVWLGFFPEQDPVQDRWVSVPTVEQPWAERYVSAQGYWLGLSYAMSLAFAAFALRRYLEQRSASSKWSAVGSVSFSGVLAVAACYMAGCCGSPMLVVYLNLFGAAFLPFAKPLVTVITAASLFASWWWFIRQTVCEPDLCSPHTEASAEGCC